MALLLPPAWSFLELRAGWATLSKRCSTASLYFKAFASSGRRTAWSAGVAQNLWDLHADFALDVEEREA